MPARAISPPEAPDEVEAEPEPVPAEKLTDIALVLASMRVSNRVTANRWLEIAQDMPAGHAVRRAADIFMKESPGQ